MENTIENGGCAVESHKTGKPQGILVFGANGSGKTTLGRELARVLHFKHMDHEAYAFRELEIPYAAPRSHEECIACMLADIKKHRQFVLSAIIGDFGEIIPQFYVLAVSMSAPLDLRVKRFDQREYERHGERVRKGGDMYESNMKFRDFIASRSMSRIEEWAETLTCPVVHIDGTLDCQTNARNVAEKFYERFGR